MGVILTASSWFNTHNRLKLSPTGPINELEQRILDSMPAIERWFRMEWMEHTPPFYTSVDVRNAGFKLAPVDTNLYPGGWNNLTPEMLPLAVQAAMAAIEKICPEARNLLLIPENHTRNTFYLSNVAQLARIFNMAGLNVRIGSINPEIKENTIIELPNGDVVTLEPVIRNKTRLGLKDFDPCTILLNNDLSAGMESLRSHVDALLTKTRRKYKEYGINEKPFVVVKADNGTYGMGIMTVRDVKDLEVINRKTRNKMSVIKDGQEVSEVIIQEGVLTNERINDAVAEPVVYMMDRYVVGGFYRVHAERGVDENLNAPGSSFVPLAFEQSAHTPQPGVKAGASVPNRFYMYGVIGRLAMLAASYELESTDPDAEIYD